jgi:hypothetical protein
MCLFPFTLSPPEQPPAYKAVIQVEPHAGSEILWNLRVNEARMILL